MEATSNALFSIGPLEVTKTVVTMWVIIVVLGLVSWLATRRLKMVPGPIQSAAEMAVTKLRRTTLPALWGATTPAGISR